MLKSTYSTGPASAPLPTGWTEHKAPTGHIYYYNAETRTSTYNRPVAEVKAESKPASSVGNDFGPGPPQHGQQGQYVNNSTSFQGYPLHQKQFEHRNQQPHYQRKPLPEDRPKHKQKIPGAEPWLLIRTKLRRRFVHNPETGKSFWKFPPDVMKAVVELDRQERERRERHSRGDFSDDEGEKVLGNGELAAAKSDQEEGEQGYDSDEYEEVEATDDEDDETQPTKKRKVGDEQPALQGPVEFDESDIAFQLAQMEQGGDDMDYEGVEAWDEAPQLSEEDSRALFKGLLNDSHINPYTPWDKIIDEGKIIEDDRYTVLPNMKSRKDAFDEWARDKVRQLKEQREKEAKQDPRIPYLAFLHNNATPKLYWPEFRRKHLKEPEMKDRKLTDREREKLYREHISRLKLPESTLKSDLAALLKSISAKELNGSTSIEALPSALLRDIRFISLPKKVRDELVETFIATAPPAPEQAYEMSPEEESKLAKAKVERDRRERAMEERKRAVQEQRDKQRRALGYSRGLLQDEEAELRRALQVGRDGLLGHLKEDEEMTGN